MNHLLILLVPLLRFLNTYDGTFFPFHFICFNFKTILLELKA